MNNGGKLKCVPKEMVLDQVEKVQELEEEKEIVSKMYKCQDCKNIFEEYYPLCPMCRSPNVYEIEEDDGKGTL